jgi:hypothetical protein
MCFHKLFPVEYIVQPDLPVVDYSTPFNDIDDHKVPLSEPQLSNKTTFNADKNSLYTLNISMSELVNNPCDLDEVIKMAYNDAMTNTKNITTFFRLQSIMSTRKIHIDECISRAKLLTYKLFSLYEPKIILTIKEKKSKKNVSFIEETKKHDGRWAEYDELFQNLVIQYIYYSLSCDDMWISYCNENNDIRLSHIESINDLIERINIYIENKKKLTHEDIKEDNINLPIYHHEIDFFDFYDQLILLPHDGIFRPKKGIPVLREGGTRACIISDEYLDKLIILSKNLKICNIAILKQPLLFLEELPDDHDEMYDEFNTSESYLSDLNSLPHYNDIYLRYSQEIEYDRKSSSDDEIKLPHDEDDIWSMF